MSQVKPDNYHQYVDLLKNNICFCSFTKKNGELRDMTCTLREDLLPKNDRPLKRVTPVSDTIPESISVWDLNKAGWRSFRLDSVKYFMPLGSIDVNEV